MTGGEFAAFVLACVAFALAAAVVLRWVFRPSPADDIEDAYLDELIARRGTPAWRRGAGAYDLGFRCRCQRPDFRGGRTTLAGSPACLQCGGSTDH